MGKSVSTLNISSVCWRAAFWIKSPLQLACCEFRNQQDKIQLCEGIWSCSTLSFLLAPLWTRLSSESSAGLKLAQCSSLPKSSFIFFSLSGHHHVLTSQAQEGGHNAATQQWAFPRAPAGERMMRKERKWEGGCWGARPREREKGKTRKEPAMPSLMTVSKWWPSQLRTRQPGEWGRSTSRPKLPWRGTPIWS